MPRWSPARAGVPEHRCRPASCELNPLEQTCRRGSFVLAHQQPALAPPPVQEGQYDGGNDGRDGGIPDEDFAPEDQAGHRADADEHEAYGPAHWALF